MREVPDGGADEPGGAGGYRAPEAGAVRELVEPRSRAEYAADLEQRATGGWTEVSFRSARVAADGADRADRAALETDFSARKAPAQVILPIAELLGPDGYRYCTGWQLEPVDGSMKAARERRDAWAGTGGTDGIEPRARPVETFEGGTVTFSFGPNRSRDGYEIVTMYVNPPDGE